MPARTGFTVNEVVTAQKAEISAIHVLGMCVRSGIHSSEEIGHCVV